MIDVKALRKLLIDKDKSLSGLAKYIGISKVTLYRKLNGESDFYREEMQKTKEYVGEENLDYIFFA